MSFSGRETIDSDALLEGQPDVVVSWRVQAMGYVAAAWCLGFAAVNGWDLVTGWDADDSFAAYAEGLAAMSILVLGLKILGAVMALLAVQSLRISPRLLATGLWGAFAVLSVYSAGNIVLTVGNATGLLEPSAAWESAGGVTPRAVAYMLFFLIGATLFGILAVSFHRRHRTPWRAAVVGVLGAPVLLSIILLIAPRILTYFGLLPP